ncbi:cytochrome c oxidase subunit II [Phaeocystidibacter luteus]|uniref:Cytochrome c oxidase subunit 2 n=1 Tax=Phaeocystidibacter luteus TaxID=911197 RepID=A0A6N6RIF8_9FLAO|nr:cytochrome c oxidase subunit II [Phaeocystidibacter luteus]KAB2813747.1 cytochrome c oxidase subunit II [Phaeocystidibacter luteus]
MFEIIGFIVAVLGIIAIAQVVKVYEASSKLKEKDGNDVTSKDNNTQGRLMLLFGILFMVSFVAMIIGWGDVMLDTPASEHGSDYDFLWDVSMAIIIVVFVIVQPILFYFAWKYRGTKGRKATYYEHNNRLELIWTVVPALTLAVLIIYGLTTWSNVMNPDNEDQEPIVVELYAQQFYWTARYAGEDNILGEANVRYIGGSNVVGINDADANGHNDIITRELVLPKGQPVLFKFRSQDIIHSAYFPHFRAQMNCVPGMVTQFQFTPTVSTEEMRRDPSIMQKVKRINEIRSAEGKESWEFDYVLLCNKICGAAHYNMQMPIRVVEQEEYDEWISEQKTFLESL